MALNTLQRYNSNSPCRTSLQHVFARPKHLYTRHPLTLPRTMSPLHVRSSHVSQRTAPSALKQSKMSPRSRHAFRDISPGPPPAPVRGVLDARRFWLSPNLRRRSTTIRAFGIEGQHRSDGLLLHNKTYITRVVLAFPLNHHCINSPVRPKLRVSRNRQPGRTWTKLPKAIFLNSNPSSVRAVPSSRWAELTTNSPLGEKRASELPRTANADADPSKRCVLPFGNFTVVRGCRRGKKVNLPVTGMIIGAGAL
jgi:hypothetical protein